MNRLLLKLFIVIGAFCLAECTITATQPFQFILHDYPHWLDSQTSLILGTRNDSDTRRLFKSGDGGMTWADITSKLANANANLLSPVYVNPYSSQIMYIAGFGIDPNSFNAWISTDGANTWQNVQPSILYINIRWHPTRPTYALSLDTSLNLYYTTDAGVTWTLLRESVIQYGWGDAGTGDVSPDRVYFIEYNPGDSIPFNFAQTESYGIHEEIVMAHCYQFVFLVNQLFAMVYLPAEQTAVLHVSPNVGDSYKLFFEGNFPFGDILENNGYAILDDTTGAVYMGINHQSINSHWGNVYLSDSVGVNYVLSFSHVGQISNGAVAYDFDGLAAVEGVYMANYLENWESGNTDRKFDNMVTYFTLDNGNTWQLLNPPHFDSQGNKIVCTTIQCNLHLAGYVGYLGGYFGPFYSAPSAIGLIIGTGSVGDHLSTNMNDINTYISRDGGLTWLEAIKGTSIYEIGDHGGIIIMAPYGVPTQIVYYTTDFGQTVRTFQFTTSDVYIWNIITEPTSTASTFIILTEDDQIFGLNFDVFPRQCDPNLDYELWSPSNGRTKLGQVDCLQGRHVVYQRRNSSAMCFNPKTGEDIVSVTNCPCIEDDYECDFGFVRQNGDPTQPCVQNLADQQLTYPPVICNGQYWKTRGYRLEADNSCQGGVDHSPSGPYDCPSSFSQVTKSQGWIAAAVIIPLVVVIIVAGCVAMRNEKLREKIPILKTLASWKVGYFGVQQPVEHYEEDDGNEFTVGIEQTPDKSDRPHEDEIEDLSEPPKEQPKQPEPKNLLDTSDSDDFNPRV